MTHVAEIISHGTPVPSICHTCNSCWWPEDAWNQCPLNIKIPSYLYRNSHYKDKTLSRQSHLYNGHPIPVKTVFILRRGPGNQHSWYWPNPPQHVGLCAGRVTYHEVHHQQLFFNSDMEQLRLTLKYKDTYSSASGRLYIQIRNKYFFMLSFTSLAQGLPIFMLCMVML